MLIYILLVSGLVDADTLLVSGLIYLQWGIVEDGFTDIAD